MAWGSPSQSLIPRKCSVPQSLMLKYPINCKSSHNHIPDLHNSFKTHSLVCILEMARGAHYVPKRYTCTTGAILTLFYFFLLFVTKGTTAYHRTRQGRGVGGRITYTVQRSFYPSNPEHVSVRNKPAESPASSKKKKKKQPIASK